MHIYILNKLIQLLSSIVERKKGEWGGKKVVFVYEDVVGKCGEARRMFIYKCVLATGVTLSELTPKACF